MKNALILASTFLVTGAVGAMGYKFYKGCPTFVKATCIQAAHDVLAKDGAFYIKATPKTLSADAIEIDLQTNFTCPIAVETQLIYKSKTLEDWPLEGVVEYAYTLPAYTRFDNSQTATLKLTPETNPELKQIPQGPYTLTVKVSDKLISQGHLAHYKDEFGLEPKQDLFVEDVTLGNNFKSLEAYGKYLQAWFDGVNKATAQGYSAKLVSELEKSFGKAKVLSRRGKTYVSFARADHTLVFDTKTGALNKPYRFSNEMEQ